MPPKRVFGPRVARFAVNVQGAKESDVPVIWASVVGNLPKWTWVAIAVHAAGVLVLGQNRSAKGAVRIISVEPNIVSLKKGLPTNLRNVQRYQAPSDKRLDLMTLAKERGTLCRSGRRKTEINDDGEEFIPPLQPVYTSEDEAAVREQELSERKHDHPKHVCGFKCESFLYMGED